MHRTDLATVARFASYDAKRKSDAHLRAIFPQSHAGGLIGFKGFYARRIQETFDIHLQVYAVHDAKWGRLVSTRGQPRNLSHAWYECAALLIENYHLYYQTHGFTVNFVFPSDLIDILLEEGEFKKIAHESELKILVKKKHLMKSAERVVRIFMPDTEPASYSKFEKAVFLLAQVVQDNLALYLCTDGKGFYVEEKSDDVVAYFESFDPEDITFGSFSEPPTKEEEPTPIQETTTEDEILIKEKIMERLLDDLEGYSSSDNDSQHESGARKCA